MRIVVTADMHIHPYRQCSRDGGHDRLLDGLSALRQSLDLARREAAVWVMVGDFKEPKTFWPQQALTGAHEILREYGDVDKVMLAGNHDAEGIGGSGLAPFKDIAQVIERPQVLITVASQFICSPWNADLSVVRTLLEKNPGSPLVAHGFLAGVVLGPDDTRAPGRGIPLAEYGDFPVAFFGDVHKGQTLVREKNRPPRWEPYSTTMTPTRSSWKIRGAAPWRGEVFYPGSPYQRNWGERNDGPKGALLADLKTGEVWLHEFTAPKFQHLECDEAELEKLIDKGTLNGWEGDFVRIVYTGRSSPALNALKDWTFRSLQVITRREQRAERRAEIHAGMPRRELLEKYAAARPLPDADPRRVIEAGMRLSEAE